MHLRFPEELYERSTELTLGVNVMKEIAVTNGVIVQSLVGGATGRESRKKARQGCGIHATHQT